MTLRDDLIAAKPLIDTPEKWSYLGGWDALLTVAGEERAFAAYDMLEQQTPRTDHHYRYFENDRANSHADIMDVWDRAIKAAS